MPIPTIPAWGNIITKGWNNLRDIWKASKERYNNLSPEQKKEYDAKVAEKANLWATDKVIPGVVLLGEIIPQTSLAMSGYAGSESWKKGNYTEAAQHMMMPVFSGIAKSGTKAALKATEKGIDAAGRALKTTDNTLTIGNALRTGKLKWGEPTTYSGWHQSMKPIKKFEFPYRRWDVRVHDADPNGAFFTINEPVKEGFLAKRRFSQQFEIPSEKPLIQTGEIKSLLGGKNNTRNAIVRYARRNGADAVEFRNIADNNLQNQNVLFMTDRINPELKKTINNRFVLREKIAPDFYDFHLRDLRYPEDIGTMQMRMNSDGYYEPHYINNLGQGYGHVSEDLYDAGIITANENRKQFLSGSILESPLQTTKIWDTYKEKGLLRVLDRKGIWENENNYVVNKPRVILKKPVWDTKVIDID